MQGDDINNFCGIFSRVLEVKEIFETLNNKFLAVFSFVFCSLFMTNPAYAIKVPTAPDMGTDAGETNMAVILEAFAQVFAKSAGSIFMLIIIIICVVIVMACLGRLAIGKATLMDMAVAIIACGIGFTLGAFFVSELVLYIN